MTLAITVVTALLLVGLALIGFVRDLRRGLAALAGTLLGALSADFWAEPLARDLAQRLRASDLDVLTRSTSTAIFLTTVLLVGYGGGALLGASAGQRTPTQRLVGALLGLVNGALVGGYLLRFATLNNPPLLEALQGSPVGRLLYEQLPRLFLVLPVAIGVLVIVRATLTLARLLSQPQPQPRGAGNGPGAATQPRPDVDRQVLNRMRERGP